jgi:hypothetical protein
VLGKVARYLISPSAVTLGAGMLALLVLLPTPVEARFLNRSLEVSKECSNRLPDHLSFRAAGPCKRETVTKVESSEPEHKIFSGKFNAALAVELYCRTTTVDLSQFTRKSTANIPHPVPQRIIPTRVSAAAEWPRCDFGPGPDRGYVEASLRVRLPDG